MSEQVTDEDGRVLNSDIYTSVRCGCLHYRLDIDRGCRECGGSGRVLTPLGNAVFQLSMAAARVALNDMSR